MINQAIAIDKRVNDLTDDTSRLAFTWLIAFADCEGRTPGDPAIIRSMLFPRREMPAATMEVYITEWAEAGLIVWYEERGDKWIWLPGFDNNQIGLRKDREPVSIVPAYIHGESKLCAGRHPDNFRQTSCRTEQNRTETEQKRTEQNRTEEKDDAASPTQFQLFAREYEQITGRLDSQVTDLVNEAMREGVPLEWLREARRRINGKRGIQDRWRYVLGIIDNWREAGGPQNDISSTAGASPRRERVRTYENPSFTGE